MQPTARSLILDLLSTLQHGTMPVAALVEAGALFGIAENAVRVTLTRLVENGLVERDERGRYRLGARAAPVERRVRSWRDLDRAVRPWRSGTWIGVAEDPSARRGRTNRLALDRHARALRLYGFRSLTPALAVRPDNLREESALLRGELRALGLDPSALVFEIGGLDDAAEARARGLWDVAALRELYRRRLAEIDASEARLGRLPPERAMVETFLLGGSIIRELVLDPLLPEEICPGAERRALATALRRYDRLGRLAWAGFLKRFDVPHARTPLDAHSSRLAERAAPAEAP